MKVLDRVDLSVGYHYGGIVDRSPVDLGNIIEEIKGNTALINVRSDYFLPENWRAPKGVTLVSDVPSSSFQFYNRTGKGDLTICAESNLLQVILETGDKTETNFFEIKRR